MNNSKAIPNPELRNLIAYSVFKAGGGHIPSCYSCIDLINELFEVFEINRPNNNYFVLSKGHAALALYSVLVKFNILNKKDLNNLYKLDSKLGGHPDAAKVPSVLFNTGSLGHGLPCSIGFAVSNRQNNIFCMLGDGECNEGTTWESATLAPFLEVGNVTVIVDYNKSTNNVLPFSDLPKIWRAYGWEVLDIDGHNLKEIKESLLQSQSNKKTPTAIIANTIKGFGVPFMENNGSWHYKCPTQQEMDLINEILIAKQ